MINLFTQWSSFFATSNHPHLESSLQVCAGVDGRYNEFGTECSRGFYTVAYRNNGSTKFLCGKTPTDRVI